MVWSMIDGLCLGFSILFHHSYEGKPTKTDRFSALNCWMQLDFLKLFGTF